MGVTTQNRVDAAHARSHLDVHIHAVVRQDDHHFGAFAAGFVDHFLHVLVLDTEGPIGHHVAWVGNRGVGEGLANDGHLHAVHLAHGVGLEDQVFKVGGLDVLCQKFDVAFEVFLDHFLHALGTEGEFPVGRHHVHAQHLAGVDHVLAVGPQGRGRTLPGIAAIEQERVWAAGFDLFDQGGQVGETADLAVGFGGLREIEVAESVRLRRTGLHTVELQELLTDDVRWATQGLTHTQVHVGFTEIHRRELRVAIGEVHEADVAELGHVVQTLSRAVMTCQEVFVIQSHAPSGGHGQHLHEFTTTEAHKHSFSIDH